MFNWQVKQEITAKNAIFLAEIGDNNGRPFKSRFLQAGLVKYDFGVCLLKKETIDKFVNTFINQPVIIGHKDTIIERDVVGYVHNIWFSPEDGWFWCDGTLKDEEAIKLVEEKGFNVSCQYRITEYTNNEDDKLHNGNPYDKEIINGIFEHLALVECPRYEDAFIAVNALLSVNEDKWITIKPNGEEGKGRHLLLKDGETPAEAIQRVYGNKDQQTLFDTSGYKKTKEDYKKEKEDKQKEYDKIEENRKNIEKDKKDKKQSEIKKAAEELTLEKFLKKHLEDFDGSYSKAMDYWEKHSKDYHTTSDENIINKHFKKEYEHYKGEKEETKYLDELKKSMDNVDSLNYSFEDVKRINEYINEAESADYDDFVKAMREKYERLPLETNEEYFERERKGNPFTDKKIEKAQTASNSFVEVFRNMLYDTLAEGIYKRLGEYIAQNEERWITIHPHGEDSEDYRRLKLEDGETPKEAIDRVYKKEDKKESEKKKETSNNYSLLPKYAKEFFEKKEKREKAKEKWHKLLAEYQEKEKEDKKFIEFQKKLDEIYKKMNEIKTYNSDFQKLINEKNKILDEKQAYKNEFYKEVYAAQEEYSNYDTSIDKKDIIIKMSNDIKKQINNISSSNDKLVSKIEKIDMEELATLQKQDEEFDKKQDELMAQIRELPYNDSKRAELRALYAEYAVKRGEIIKKQKEARYKTALEVGKLLQVKNGVKLNVKNSSIMQEITEKLKNCLDGVIPASNFDNVEMTIKKHEGRAFQSGSTINISYKEKIETAIHETMHHLEEHSEHVLMNSLAFATSRTEGEKQESLRRLTGKSYKTSEVCKKDKFFNPYCGKLYDVFGGRNKTFANCRASEIMSMGVQELFTNPKEFAKNDREYFDFVVANLQGTLWT